MSEPGGKSSGSEVGAYAHSGLGTGPRGGCCPSQALQVAPSQEGNASTQVRYPPQGVSWSRSGDGVGQDVLPYLQQSHPE